MTGTTRSPPPRPETRRGVAAVETPKSEAEMTPHQKRMRATQKRRRRAERRAAFSRAANAVGIVLLAAAAAGAAAAIGF